MRQQTKMAGRLHCLLLRGEKRNRSRAHDGRKARQAAILAQVESDRQAVNQQARGNPEVAKSKGGCLMQTLDLGNGIVTQVDDADFEAVHEVGFSCGLVWRGFIANHIWRAKKVRHTTYAICSLNGAVELRLHRVILNAKAEQLVDHRDSNGLNNLRENLRLATDGGNSHNRRPLPGKTTKETGSPR
jgi:hypothetical protein